MDNSDIRILRGSNDAPHRQDYRQDIPHILLLPALHGSSPHRDTPHQDAGAAGAVATGALGAGVLLVDGLDAPITTVLKSIVIAKAVAITLVSFLIGIPPFPDIRVIYIKLYALYLINLFVKYV